MPELKYPNWQKPYQEALLELDPSVLYQKMLDAETAIFARLQRLTDGEAHLEGTPAERLAIDDAISGLRALQKHRLKFPDSP